MQLNAFSTALIAATIINATLAYFTWKKRPAAGSTVFFILLIAVSVWTFFAVFEAISRTVFYKTLFSVLTYPGIVSVPVFFFIFVCSHAKIQYFLKAKNLAFLFIIPVLTVVMAATNSFHRLLWKEVSLGKNDLAGIYGIYSPGAWFWVNIAYSYILVVAALLILIAALLRFRHLYNLQSRILIIASLAPFLANLVYAFSPKSIVGFDITPVFFTVSGIFLYYALFYFKLFDLSPVAWETIIESMDDGVILFNLQDKVVDVNEKFSEILGIEKVRLGMQKDAIFSKIPEMSILYDLAGKNQRKEVSFNKNGSRTYLQITSSPLFNRDKKKVIGSIFIFRDITASKISEQKLKETKNLLSDIIDFLPDPTCAIDMEGRVIVWNKTMEKLSGIKKKDILGKSGYPYSVPFYGKPRPVLLDLVLHRDLNIENLYDNIEYIDDKITAEARISNKANNMNFYFWSIASPLYGPEGQIIGSIESVRDITDRKNMEKKLKHISFHDPLTKLYNRAFFEEELKRLDSPRYMPTSIIMSDVNGLKLVNDAFGHDNGDSLLRQAAKIIKSCCRGVDVVARWGGDEFVILLPQTNTAQALKIIERIKEACDKTSGLKIPVSIALGCATKTVEKDSVRNILKKAEDKMYRSKLLEAKSVQNQIVKSLTNTLYEKNIETVSHSKRVIDLSIKMGQKLKLAPDRMDELILHASLHDIGKVAVGEEIIKKKGKLTDEEWHKVKKHSEAGYRIASSSSLLVPIADYILAQHEWYNGKGYPRGLKGDNIPLISRIVAIADAYDVMISKRSYKKTKSRQEAIEELKKFAGIQFDPELVKVFIEIIQ